MKLPMRQIGYTLIELLLYVALVGILLSAVTVFFGMTADARLKNQTISEVNEQGMYALDYIAQTVRNANSITQPAIGANGSQLTVTVPTSALSPTVFSLANGVLQVKEGTSTAISLTGSKTQVSVLTFTNLSRAGTSGIVQISLTLNRINNGGRNEYDYQRTFTTSAGMRP
jgi:Tfp pilus assembly protein PilW